jgi:hypothetical protein
LMPIGGIHENAPRKWIPAALPCTRAALQQRLPQ